MIVAEPAALAALLTPEQLVEINGAFKKFDQDGNGHIDVGEIQTVMTNLGYPKSYEEAAKLASAVDADGNGTIEFDEFIGLIAHKMLKTDGYTELAFAMEHLFDDSSGCAPPWPSWAMCPVWRRDGWGARAPIC